MPTGALLLFEVAFAVAMGLLIGSFLNVCIYRVPRDLSVVHPRSFCPECGVNIAWFDNVPLLSYLFLKGQCRSCRLKIGWRYPVVELLTAVLFGATVARYGWTLDSVKWCVFEALMMALFWIDLEERLLPDEFTIGGTVVGLIFACFTKVPGLFGEMLFTNSPVIWQSLFEAFGGAIVLTVPIASLGILWGHLRKKEVLGLGDVKLLPCIGVFLGIENGVSTLMVGSVLGTVLGGTYILLKKKSAAEYELPLGSFFCAAAAVAPFLKTTP